MKRRILNIIRRIAGTEQLAEQTRQINWQLSNLQYWQKNFHHFSEDNPEKFPVLLTGDEVATLQSYQRKSDIYLEFGAGGSTFLALNAGAAKIYSVESDLSWIEFLECYKQIRTAERMDKLNFYCINIGRLKPFGYPIDDSRKEHYKDYSDIYSKQAHLENADSVFIDGRFRVACALATALNCKKDTAIMIHDYTNREYYHVVEQFLDIVKITDSLAVFKIKSDIDKDKAETLYAEYQYDPR